MDTYGHSRYSPKNKGTHRTHMLLTLQIYIYIYIIKTQKKTGVPQNKAVGSCLVEQVLAKKPRTGARSLPRCRKATAGFQLALPHPRKLQLPGPSNPEKRRRVHQFHKFCG